MANTTTKADQQYKDFIAANRNILRGIAADPAKWAEFLTILAYNKNMTPLNAARIQAIDIDLDEKKVLAETGEWAKRVLPKEGEDSVSYSDIIKKDAQGRDVGGIVQATRRGGYNHLVKIYPRSSVDLAIRRDAHLYPFKIDLRDPLGAEIWKRSIDNLATTHTGTEKDRATGEEKTYTVEGVDFAEEDPNVQFAIETRYGMKPTVKPELPNPDSFDLRGDDPASLMAYCRDMQKRITQLSNRLDRAIFWERNQILKSEEISVDDLSVGVPVEKAANVKAEKPTEAPEKPVVAAEKPMKSKFAGIGMANDPASRREAARAEAKRANGDAVSTSHAIVQ